MTPVACDHRFSLPTRVRSVRRGALIALGAMAMLVTLGCATINTASTSTAVKAVWKDPKYSLAPMNKVFVISLMKIEPGGRDAVEDAIVKELRAAGVDAVASHSQMSSDPRNQKPLIEVIRASGADGVLMARVKWMSAFEPYTVGETVESPAPDRMGFSDFLDAESADQPGDYKVARISTSIFQGALGKQVWTAYTDSYNAGNLSRVLNDYTVRVVGALAKDRIIAGTVPKT